MEKKMNFFKQKKPENRMQNTQPQPPKKEESVTLGDLFSKREGNVLINFTKLNEIVKQCKADRDNQTCREELKKIGVEWMD
jgi:hypothetical protein